MSRKAALGCRQSMRKGHAMCPPNCAETPESLARTPDPSPIRRLRGRLALARLAINGV